MDITWELVQNFKDGFVRALKPKGADGSSGTGRAAFASRRAGPQRFRPVDEVQPVRRVAKGPRHDAYPVPGAKVTERTAGRRRPRGHVALR